MGECVGVYTYGRPGIQSFAFEAWQLSAYEVFKLLEKARRRVGERPGVREGYDVGNAKEAQRLKVAVSEVLGVYARVHQLTE